MTLRNKRWIVQIRYPEFRAFSHRQACVSAPNASDAISRGYERLTDGVSRFRRVEEGDYAAEIRTGELLPTYEYSSSSGRLIRCELGVGVTSPTDGGSAAFNVFAFERPSV